MAAPPQECGSFKVASVSRGGGRNGRNTLVVEGELSAAGQQVNLDVMNLRALLMNFLPAAIDWAEARSRKALALGTPLTPREEEVARAVGVSSPSLVRVEMVHRLPLPDDLALRNAALQAGLLGQDMVGLTLGHAIFICHGHKKLRLVSHELRHVHQYEQHGSIAGFLPLYLAQIAEFGYGNAPFEVDARAHEVLDA